MPKPKTSTVSHDPFSFIPTSSGPTPEQFEAAPPAAPPSSRVAREKLTIPLSVGLVDRLRNAAYWDPELTIAGIAERALTREIDRIEEDRGSPFPPRKSQLKGGRPIGSGRS